MPKMFLSYRQADSIDITGRVYDRLTAHFGKDSVFMDVDSIPLGVDFRTFLSDWVSKCDLLIAMIGDQWLNARDSEGNPRLGNPADFVTIEISAAMKRGIPVIPILVGQATMPKHYELPEIISDLAYRNAAEVRSGRDFHYYMDRVIKAIENQFPAKSAKQEISNQASESKPSELLSNDTAYIVVEKPAVAKPTNLGFEGDVINNMPIGWFNSLGFVSGVSPLYEVSVQVRSNGTGKCARLQRSKADKNEFGSLMQRCPAYNLVGKCIRVEAEMRTEKLDSWAGLWLRIDDVSNLTHLFFNNMNKCPIRGTTPWTTYTQETVVPIGSGWLNYGILLVSNGTLWVDNFNVRLLDHQGQWNAI